MTSLCCFAQATPIKLIYDTDAATDDAIALIYLAHQDNVTIEGITIAGTGEAHGLPGAKNMADLCYALGKPNIPVAYGREVSFEQLGHPFPNFLRELMDHMFANKNVPHHPRPNISNSAVELMRKIADANTKVSILATGPLTNVAEFITTYPELKNKIDKIVIMGGAVYVKGNIKGLDPASENELAEWNIYADPKAAEIVFTSTIPVVLVPLDATSQVPMTMKYYEALSKETQPDLRLIYLLLKDIVDTFGLEAFLRTFYLWDPLAAMIHIDPSRARTIATPIAMDLKTAQTKPVKNSRFPIINVVVTVNKSETVLDDFLAAIKGV